MIIVVGLVGMLGVLIGSMSKIVHVLIFNITASQYIMAGFLTIMASVLLAIIKIIFMNKEDTFLNQ